METFHINDSNFLGYLALPRAGKGPGLLLFHAWWGLNEFIVQTCGRLAAEGFVILAPDYYAGETAAAIDEAKKLRQQMDRNATKKLIDLAIDYLVSHPATKKPHIGTIGFSLGASFAIEAARRKNKSVNAVVVFYGSGGGNFDKTDASFMGHFAENDQWGAHAKKIAALKDRIQGANQGVNFYTYPETEHWFFETDRPEYHQEASELAWERTITFLKNILG